MSRLNQNPRVFNTRFRNVTVLRPEAPSSRDRDHRLNDYVTVPAIDIRGTFRMRELLSLSNVADLGMLANEMERKRGSRRYR